MLAPLEVGDLVAIRDAGAYGSAMASNYNRHPLPAEVLVDEGRWRVIRRRQTIDDMTALETIRLRTAMAGHLIAFEGLDQSGKQTQAELLRDRLKQEGHKARLVSFPDYATSIGEELARALQGEREYGPDVMQLLYVANRYERKPDLLRWLEGGLILVCDRYVASSIAYGEAQGLDGALAGRDSAVPAAAVADHRARHRARNRGQAEGGRSRSVRARPVAADARPRELPRAGSAASRQGWVVLDGERAKDEIAADVFSAVASRLALP